MDRLITSIRLCFGIQSGKFLIHKGSCKVEKADDEGIISGYLTSWKNLRLDDPDKWDFRYYRQNVLEKLVVR